MWEYFMSFFSVFCTIVARSITIITQSISMSCQRIIRSLENTTMARELSKDKLNFRSSCSQLLDLSFCLTNYGCYICQQNFNSLSNYDDHIGIHKEIKDIPFVAPQFQSSQPTFEISYKYSAGTKKLTFTITSNKDVSIEKIVIIRPERRKLMHLIEKSKIQCAKEKRTYNTSVDCILFNIAEEMPFIIIYRDSRSDQIRKLEEFIFFKKDEFSSNLVPQNAKLELIHQLPQNFPTKIIVNLGKENYKEKDVIASHPAMRQFLTEKRLQKSNYVDVLSFLLQMEDHFVLSNYEKINLSNVAITSLGSDNYSFILPQMNKVKQFLGVYDEIVISNLTYTQDYYDEDIFKYSYDQGEPTKYVGCVNKIEGNTVYFSRRGKIKIPTTRRYNTKIYPCRIPFRYQHEAIKMISSSDHILKVLFPTQNPNNHLSSIRLHFFNKSVKHNPEQSQAVRNIVNAPNNSMPFILFGPPGTGKSTTILESVLQLWKTKPLSKILVTSGSNAACDEIGKRLCKIFEEIDGEGYNMLRIYATSSGRKMDNTEEFLVEASNFAYGYHFYPSLDSIYLFRIVIATLSICGKLVQAGISDSYFSHIIIDECAASTESEALVGIAGLMGPKTKLILSGDPKQLGPVLKCMPAQHFGFGISMMERLLNLKCYAVDPLTNNYDNSILTILRRNFRSNAGILSISNELCYNSQLLACAKPELTDWVHGWKNLPSKSCPLIFHNVYGQTEKENGGTSSMNSDEIEVVMEYVRDILENGINGRTVEQNEIGIISPYKKQYSEIRKRLDRSGWSKVETGSAETFQGQEKPIIIISTVKSFTKYIGFLNNLKRLNVMLTRAQALMIIVGNAKSLQNDGNWLQVLKYFQKKKAFKGQNFKLFKKYTSSDANLMPDVPKTGENLNNNRRQFKPRNPHQPYNVLTESNKTAPHDKKKENETSSQTESMIRRKHKSTETEVLNINKNVEMNPTINNSLPTTSSLYNSGTSHFRDSFASTSKTSASRFQECKSTIYPRLGTEALPRIPTRFNPEPSAPLCEDLIPNRRDENIPVYRDPPPTYYETCVRDLNEMKLRKNKMPDDAPRPRKVKRCVIL